MKTLLNASQELLAATGMPPLKCQCKECAPGMIFRCDSCNRLMPWCMGASDDMPNSCDDCWVKIRGGAA